LANVVKRPKQKHDSHLMMPIMMKKSSSSLWRGDR
jgi:hypothetical protein